MRAEERKVEKALEGGDRAANVAVHHGLLYKEDHKWRTIHLLSLPVQKSFHANICCLLYPSVHLRSVTVSGLNKEISLKMNHKGLFCFLGTAKYNQQQPSHFTTGNVCRTEGYSAQCLFNCSFQDRYKMDSFETFDNTQKTETQGALTLSHSPKCF